MLNIVQKISVRETLRYINWVDANVKNEEEAATLVRMTAGFVRQVEL